jgi:hypothetical protein
VESDDGGNTGYPTRERFRVEGLGKKVSMQLNTVKGINAQLDFEPFKGLATLFEKSLDKPFIELLQKVPVHQLKELATGTTTDRHMDRVALNLVSYIFPEVNDLENIISASNEIKKLGLFVVAHKYCQCYNSPGGIMHSKFRSDAVEVLTSKAGEAQRPQPAPAGLARFFTRM